LVKDVKKWKKRYDDAVFERNVTVIVTPRLMDDFRAKCPALEWVSDEQLRMMGDCCPTPTHLSNLLVVVAKILDFFEQHISEGKTPEEIKDLVRNRKRTVVSSDSLTVNYLAARQIEKFTDMARAFLGAGKFEGKGDGGTAEEQAVQFVQQMLRKNPVRVGGGKFGVVKISDDKILEHVQGEKVITVEEEPGIPPELLDMLAAALVDEPGQEDTASLKSASLKSGDL